MWLYIGRTKRLANFDLQPALSNKLCMYVCYYPTAAKTVQITVQIYSDVVQLFVQ